MNPTESAVIRRQNVFKPWTVYALGYATFILAYLLLVHWRYPLPFVDTLGFCFLDSLPTKHAFGDTNFYMIQFTYVFGHLLGRILTHLKFSEIGKFHVFFLLQCSLLWWSVAALCKAVSLPDTLGLGVLALSFMAWVGNGIAMWGGPLYYSLMAFEVWMLYAMIFTLQGGQPRLSVERLFVISVFTVICMMTHPFAFPFLCMLAVALWPYADRNTRIQCITVLAVSAFWSWLCYVDRPLGFDPNSTFMKTLLATPFSLRHPRVELKSLWNWDGNITNFLLGYRPPLLSLIQHIGAAFRIAGLVFSPIVLISFYRDLSSRVKALLTLNILTWAYYFFPYSPVGISMWPQRILLFATPVQISAAIVSCYLLTLKGIDSHNRFLAAGRDSHFERLWTPRVTKLVLTVAFGAWGLFFANIRNLNNLGADFVRETNRLNSGILSSGVHNCLLKYDGFGYIQPFWLRAVPFTPFTNEAIRARGVVVYTEWHVVPQHCAKIPDSYVAEWLRHTCTVTFAPSEPSIIKFSISTSTTSSISNGMPL